MSTISLPAPKVIDPVRGQTFHPADASEGTPMQFPGPFAGLPDELVPAYRDSRRDSYAAAHLEADADDLACEVDALRTELDALDYTPQQFADVMADQCPGVLYSLTATQYVASTGEYAVDPSQPVKIETRYEGWANFPGVSTRHLSAASWRELAAFIVAEHKMRRGLSGVPVVDVATA